MYNAKWSIFYTLKWSIMKLNQLHTCIIHTNVSFSLELTRWYPAIQFIAVQRTNICTKVLQRFVYSEERCTFFKGRKMNHCCLCVCFATMRLLFNMSIVFLQRCTIIARPISLNDYTKYVDFKIIFFYIVGLGFYGMKCPKISGLGRHEYHVTF